MADPEFLFLGDALWLDFVNTRQRAPAEPIDRLPDAAAYRRWTAARRLRHDGSSSAFRDVLQLRTRLESLADALAAGRRPPSAVVEAINTILSSAPGHQCLTRVGGSWQVRFSFPTPPTAVVAIVQSAAATLADSQGQVRRCASERCGLFLLDDSLTQSRRFCRASCGGSRFVERRRGILR
ncbi:MAG TPA: CGNR zinc finger domain-containing protein [Gemmatimonadales bacterium]|nr:CGNR zinc finger domain-containing protein [Gemmatimonadales bacterium]